jgi:flagella basal body P-ring formation protein FlgA
MQSGKKTMEWMIGILAVTLVWLASVAQARAEVTSHDFTTPELREQLVQTLIDQGAAEHLTIHLYEQFPAVLYRHTAPITPAINITKLDETAHRFSATVQLESEGAGGRTPVGQSFVVEGRYEPWVRVPSVAHRVSGDTPITEADIAWLNVPEHRVGRDTLLEPTQIIGQAPRRVLMPGRPIQAEDVMKPQVIKKNDNVTMVFETPHMQLRAMGVAMGDGAVGDRVSVRNPDSHATVYAIVQAPGVVRVAPRMVETSWNQ